MENNESVEIIGHLPNGTPIVDANTSVDLASVPWAKLKPQCKCNPAPMRVYLLNGDYQVICQKCALVILYSGEVVNASPEELAKNFKFPMPAFSEPDRQKQVFQADAQALSELTQLKG